MLRSPPRVGAPWMHSSRPPSQTARPSAASPGSGPSTPSGITRHSSTTCIRTTSRPCGTRPSRSSTRLAVPAFPDSYGPRYIRERSRNRARRSRAATQRSGGRAMSELLGIARFKFHEGKLEEFKRLSAQAMEIVRTKDTGTLQYDTYFNDDQSECIVIERYRDSEAAMEHASNLADLSEAVLATVSVVHGEVLGEPSAELRANLADSEVPQLFTPYESM